MILGRPTNLWAGLVSAIFGAIGATAIIAGVDPAIVATLSTSYLGVAGSVIALLAVQTPTVTPGSDVKVQTPAGQPNATATLGLTRDGDLVVGSPDSNVALSGEIQQ